MMRYRFDREGPATPNGGRPVYTDWMGGPTLAGVRNCRVDWDALSPRTVYTTGEPDTFFSIPARCRHRGRTVRGFLTSEAEGYVFVPHQNSLRQAKGLPAMPLSTDGAPLSDSEEI